MAREDWGSDPVFGRPEVSSTRPDGETIFLPELDAGDRRIKIYVALAFALVVGAILIQRVEIESSPELHTLWELAGTVLSFTVGALSLVGFYSRGSSTFLFLGTGFLANGLLEGYHATITSTPLLSPGSPEAASLMAWSWIAARVFLSLFLFVSWLAWYQEDESSRLRVGRPVRPGSVFTTAGALTVVIFVFFATFPLADAYRPGALLSRPGELAPGVLFGLALTGFLGKGDWRSDVFEHWLIMALILSVFTHLAFLIFSEQPYDAPFVAAHGLKVLSYLAVLVGFVASVYLAFQRERQASAAILEANSALANEVKTRRRAEQVLQDSEERLQDFLDNATDLIQSTDPNGRILYVNQAWKLTLGYSNEELRDMDILSIIHPDSRDTFRKTMRRVFQGDAVSDFEITFVARSGQHVICSGSSNCRFEAGRPVATRSILRNITEELRAQGELARSQANVRALFESTGDAIWSVDRSHRLITFNTAYALMAEVISGRVPEVGDEAWRLTPTEDLEWYRACYDRALAGSRFSATREDRVAGQGRVFELFFNPIEGEDGVSGVVVFSKDVTRRQIAEEALRSAKLEAEEANQAKSQFLASMSHELRTPLNSVIGFANILLKNRSGALEEKELGYLDRILANGKHLLSLINEVLDLSKIEAGRMELEEEVVDLSGLIEETLGQMEGQVAGKPVVLRSEIDASPEPFRTDPGKLKQVLINLVGNALKFTSEGEVVVEVETDRSGKVPERIHVRDTGPGIPDDRLEAIFEAFQQADSSTARKFGGTGLGLAISRSLCALMGYRIGVASTLGEGSTFTIHLVVAVNGGGALGTDGLDDPPRDRWAPAIADESSTWKAKTVLLVDDESDSRDLLEECLEETGCRVVRAVDGIEGLEVARAERPDLITVDLMMPRMSGWEMVKALRMDDDLRDIPALVVSAVATEENPDLPVDMELLEKPFSREEVARVVRRYLSEKAYRVLVVEKRPEARGRLVRYLREAGLVVRGVEDKEAAARVAQRMRMHVVVVDLEAAAPHADATIDRLRGLSSLRDTPIVALVSAESEAIDALLERGVKRVVRKGPGLEAELRGALDELIGVSAGVTRE